MATQLENVIKQIEARKKQYPLKRVWIKSLIVEKDGKKVNGFLQIFSKLCQLYHYRITQKDDFLLHLTPEYKKKLKFLYNYITNEKSNKGLYIFGGYGTGKSMTLWALAEMFKLFVPEFEYSMLTANQIIALYRETADSKDWHSFNNFKYKKLLIIDDLGSEDSTTIVHFGNKVKPIENIIESRYKSGLWTWATSNYSLQQLAEKYSGYIIDRLRQMMYFIEFNWNSYRK